MIQLATIVDTKALLETGLAAFVAGVGVAFTFSFAILGATRFAELSREQRSLAAIAYATLGLLGLAASIAAIVAGLIVMTSD